MTLHASHGLGEHFLISLLKGRMLQHTLTSQVCVNGGVCDPCYYYYTHLLMSLCKVAPSLRVHPCSKNSTGITLKHRRVWLLCSAATSSYRPMCDLQFAVSVNLHCVSAFHAHLNICQSCMYSYIRAYTYVYCTYACGNEHLYLQYLSTCHKVSHKFRCCFQEVGLKPICALKLCI